MAQIAMLAQAKPASCLTGSVRGRNAPSMKRMTAVARPLYGVQQRQLVIIAAIDPSQGADSSAAAGPSGFPTRLAAASGLLLAAAPVPFLLPGLFGGDGWGNGGSGGDGGDGGDGSGSGSTPQEVMALADADDDDEYDDDDEEEEDEEEGEEDEEEGEEGEEGEDGKCCKLAWVALMSTASCHGRCIIHVSTTGLIMTC